MVTQRTHGVTLCFDIPGRARFSQRLVALGVALGVARARCVPPRSPPSGLCQVNRAKVAGRSFDGVANGGVSQNLVAGRVIVGLLCVHTAWRHMHTWVCRRQGGGPARRAGTAGRPAVSTGILIRLWRTRRHGVSGMGAFEWAATAEAGRALETLRTLETL
jgi:hypothetical protein